MRSNHTVPQSANEAGYTGNMARADIGRKAARDLYVSEFPT